MDLGPMAKESLDHIGFAGFYREMERGIIVLKIPDLLRPICVRFVSTIQIQRMTRKSVTPREYTFFKRGIKRLFTSHEISRDAGLGRKQLTLN